MFGMNFANIWYRITNAWKGQATICHPLPISYACKDNVQPHLTSIYKLYIPAQMFQEIPWNVIHLTIDTSCFYLLLQRWLCVMWPNTARNTQFNTGVVIVNLSFEYMYICLCLCDVSIYITDKLDWHAVDQQCMVILAQPASCCSCSNCTSMQKICCVIYESVLKIFVAGTFRNF